FSQHHIALAQKLISTFVLVHTACKPDILTTCGGNLCRQCGAFNRTGANEGTALPGVQQHNLRLQWVVQLQSRHIISPAAQPPRKHKWHMHLCAERPHEDSVCRQWSNLTFRDMNV